MFNGTSLAGAELAAYVCPAEKALELKFVRKAEDFFDDDLAFAAEYTHQVFGETEAIFGYKNLKIQLYYTPDHLDTFVGIKYDHMVDPRKHDGIKADNVLNTLSEYIPEGFFTNKDKFFTCLAKSEPFKPFGTLLNVSQTDNGRTFEVYKTDISAPGFSQYHEKLQTFLLWFVETASFINTEDWRWSYYLVFEKAKEKGATDPTYSVAGYCTVYSFYAYPDMTRPRISQMLILPPFQRKGLGTQLLQAIYDDLVPDKTVLDITVEDPSPEFSAIKDYVDCKNAMDFECFQLPKILEPYSAEMEKICREKLKLHRAQCRRVYEIMRLRAIDRSNSEQYRQYRLTVKNRLNGPYQKQQQDLKKLQAVMKPAELAVSLSVKSREDRMRELHEQYQRLEDSYRTVLEKLAAITS